MTKVSGIDILEDILREMKQMRKEMRVLDQNIKRIANFKKVKGLGEISAATAKPTISQQVEGSNPSVIKQSNLRFKFETVDASKTKQISPNRSDRAAPKVTACMCYGKMVAESKGKTIPLPGLNVKVYNDKDVLVKETKTNRAGEWRCKLGANNYVANIEGKFNGNDLYPVNLGFVVIKGMEKLEVK